MTPIDKNDAPEGYVAVEAGPMCNGCAFYVVGCSHYGDHHCVDTHRADGRNVIFVKAASHRATANFPCGSLGEEVA